MRSRLPKSRVNALLRAEGALRSFLATAYPLYGDWTAARWTLYPRRSAHVRNVSRRSCDLPNADAAERQCTSAQYPAGWMEECGHHHSRCCRRGRPSVAPARPCITRLDAITYHAPTSPAIAAGGMQRQPDDEMRREVGEEDGHIYPFSTCHPTRMSWTGRRRTSHAATPFETRASAPAAPEE